MPDAPETVTEALALLAGEGFTADFDLLHTSAICAQCETGHDLTHVVIERQYRFEGMSDPDDEAIVLALRCPSCGAKGVIVSAFGPNADPELFAILANLPNA